MKVLNIFNRGNIPHQEQKSEIFSKNEKEIVVASVFKRIISSPLFWTSLAVTANVVFTFMAVATPPLGLSIRAIILIATVVFGGIAAIAKAKRKHLLYEISLAYNYINNKINPEKWTVYNKITDDLYLGRLPLKNTGDHKVLIERENIGAVLSVIENFENRTLGILSDPVTPEDWATLGIDQMQIETPDFCPLSVQDIERGVNYIEENINKGVKVYTQCKAGRARSAAIVASYLIKSKKVNTVEEAVTYVKEKRIVTNLGRSKIDSIKEYVKAKCS